MLIESTTTQTKKKSINICFHLGEIIEANELSAKQCKKIVSDYYYLTSIRTYYIFESSPLQIEKTLSTTLSLIRRLLSEEYRSLVLEI